MINISDRYRCIFVHIPKGAGTSVKQALALPGRGHPPWNWFAVNFPRRWNDYLKFTIVRNPWDRFVSAYVYATTKESYWHGESKGLHPDYPLLSDSSFVECCEIARHNRNLLKHESWYPQYHWLVRDAGECRQIMVDLVLRYENLEVDFAMLSDRLGLESPVIPYINASQHSGYRGYYNDHTRSVVAELYAADIELFGYDF